MKKVLTQMKDRWVRILLFVIAFSFIPMSLEYWFNTVMHMDYWVEYEGIVVVEPVRESDDVIFVLSFAEIKRETRIEWTDVLYCNRGNGFEFVTSQSDSRVFTNQVNLPRKDISPEGVETPIPWRFHSGNVLHLGDLCRIQSTITANLPLGVEKNTTVTSPDFTIQ